MHRSQSLEAIVLKTYDVGEADRYCIFFTRERGKVAARASGVRKTKSRMGGAFVAFQHLTLELRESGAGWMVTGAQPRAGAGGGGLASFASRAQGCELLLRLVQEEEEQPAVFDDTLAFFRACDEGVPHALLAFKIRLLHLFGFLPHEEEAMGGDALSADEQLFLHAARGGYFLREASLRSIDRLERLCSRFLDGQLSSPLKAPGVAAAMRESELS